MALVKKNRSLSTSSSSRRHEKRRQDEYDELYGPDTSGSLKDFIDDTEDSNTRTVDALEVARARIEQKYGREIQKAVNARMFDYNERELARQDRLRDKLRNDGKGGLRKRNKWIDDEGAEERKASKSASSEKAKVAAVSTEEEAHLFRSGDMRPMALKPVTDKELRVAIMREANSRERAQNSSLGKLLAVTGCIPLADFAYAVKSNTLEKVINDFSVYQAQIVFAGDRDDLLRWLMEMDLNVQRRLQSKMKALKKQGKTQEQIDLEMALFKTKTPQAHWSHLIGDLYRKYLRSSESRSKSSNNSSRRGSNYPDEIIQQWISFLIYLVSRCIDMHVQDFVAEVSTITSVEKQILLQYLTVFDDTSYARNYYLLDVENQKGRRGRSSSKRISRKRSSSSASQRSQAEAGKQMLKRKRSSSRSRNSSGTHSSIGTAISESSISNRTSKILHTRRNRGHRQHPDLKVLVADRQKRLLRGRNAKRRRLNVIASSTASRSRSAY